MSVCPVSKFVQPVSQKLLLNEILQGEFTKHGTGIVRPSIYQDKKLCGI